MNRRAVVIALTLAGAPLVLAAQSPPRIIRLKPADAHLSEEFTSIGSLRELSDGRILVADDRETRLVVADLRTGTVESVGRKGSGPREFRSIDALFALAGDSTLLVDSELRRWLLLSGPRIVATLPPDAPATLAAHLGEMGADRAGHLLVRLNAGRLAGDPQRRLDSPYVALVDRRTGRADTATRVRPMLSVQVAATYNPDGSLASSRSIAAPLTAFEQIALFPDGWLAIARLEPYRVEWRTPAGRWIRGAPIAMPVINVDEREKRFWMAHSSGSATPADPNTVKNWPATVPPFASPSSGVFAAPDGSLVVTRIATADHDDTRYDIIDRRGAVTGQLTLPKNERIIAFGARSVFLAITDRDDIQRLERRPWP